jgi:cytoskeletal protein CcmA (bactofilin family)
MKIWTSIVIASALLATPILAAADEANLSFGGDQYTAGQQAAIETDVARDAFVAGYNVSITAPVEGDGHLAGFSVSTTSPVTQDVYAAGYSVSIGAPVGGDLTAMGNNLVVGSSAAIGGNVRAAGQTVTLDGPINGSAIVTAQTLTLNTSVAGDFSFIGENIAFAPGARVAGKLSIQAPREIAVPAEVAAADRVSFTQLVHPDYVGEAGRTAENVVKGFWPAFWAAAGWLVFLFVLGAALIALLPARIHAMEAASEKRPFRTLGLGILTLASTLGLLLVAVISIIGIVTLPFVFIYIAIACSLAYLAGAYLIGLRIGGAFVSIDSNLKRLGTLALALIAAVLLGAIPVLGWLITLLVTAFGFGAFALVTMVRWSAKDAPRIQTAEGSAIQPAV